MSKQPDIQIEVRTHFLLEQSNPEEDRYAFAYTVEICNRSDEMVKLLNRYWHITDDNEKVEESSRCRCNWSAARNSAGSVVSLYQRRYHRNPIRQHARRL